MSSPLCFHNAQLLLNHPYPKSRAEKKVSSHYVQGGYHLQEHQSLCVFILLCDWLMAIFNALITCILDYLLNGCLIPLAPSKKWPLTTLVT